MILDKGKPRKNGVNDAKHHNQMKVRKKDNFMIKEHEVLYKVQVANFRSSSK
jgi:hypothetical protein